MRGLKGKRFVIAGGGSGIGAATAKRLAEEGAKVVVGDINQAGADKTAAEITAAGGAASGFRFDLADEPSCKALIQACVDRHGGIDGLANVGAEVSHNILGRDLDLLLMSEDVWLREVQVNLLGHIRTIRAALPHFVAQRDGAIVCVSSEASVIGEPTRPGYATTKVGLHAVIRHVARRWGPDNVRCNAVAPGPVATETSAQFGNEEHREVQRRLVESLPLRRTGSPAEVAASIAFLLSSDGAWITGQVWGVSGGQVMRD